MISLLEEWRQLCSYFEVGKFVSSLLDHMSAHSISPRGSLLLHGKPWTRPLSLWSHCFPRWPEVIIRINQCYRAS